MPSLVNDFYGFSVILSTARGSLYKVQGVCAPSEQFLFQTEFKICTNFVNPAARNTKIIVKVLVRFSSINSSCK